MLRVAGMSLRAFPRTARVAASSCADASSVVDAGRCDTLRLTLGPFNQGIGTECAFDSRQHRLQRSGRSLSSTAFPPPPPDVASALTSHSPTPLLLNSP